MSKIIASAGINGAYTIVDRARNKYEEALGKYGPDREVGFPNTGYFLPIIYGILGVAVKKLSDMGPVLDRAASLLPPRVKETHNLPVPGARAGRRDGDLLCRGVRGGDPLPRRPEFLSRREGGGDRRFHLAGGGRRRDHAKARR